MVVCSVLSDSAPLSSFSPLPCHSQIFINSAGTHQVLSVNGFPVDTGLGSEFYKVLSDVVQSRDIMGAWNLDHRSVSLGTKPHPAKV